MTDFLAMKAGRQKPCLSRFLIVFICLIVFGIAGLFVVRLQSMVAAETQSPPPSICYSCFWHDHKLQADVISYYKSHVPSDPLAAADAKFILWRATGKPRCSVLDQYRLIAANSHDPDRALMASATAAFASPECGADPTGAQQRAAQSAERAGRSAEAAIFQGLATKDWQPVFGYAAIQTSLHVPAQATTMVLGNSAVPIEAGSALGTQVERVVRDWLSYQMRWGFTSVPVQRKDVLWYHEGALVRQVMDRERVTVLPLAGTLVAANNGKWYAPDEQGTFRFEVLEDKMQYPTTHVAGGVGWIPDTHGISALVSQAVERKVSVVVGCGDSEGKARAAFYLAQRGINVIFPADRFADLLIGYTGPGTLIGTAPVKKVRGHVVVGAQPVRFSLGETFVVQDTKELYPYGYYDAPARYFRRLATLVPLRTEFVEVQGPDQIKRVLDRADKLNSTAVAVRVYTSVEDAALRRWLDKSSEHRAILFHSGLYPYAQKLFGDYPDRVTFGDLHPRFH